MTMLLITTAMFVLNGKIVEAGTVLQTSNASALLASGCARKLSRAEAKERLAEFAEFADELFNGNEKKSAKGPKNYNQGNLF